ncbi:STAS/SEC14 domain-containing protein [candidate division WOR-3 bacterium]|nr:STAS/SEC14 domain-containing protein [candidate division WOR-3 bacterium]
MAKVTQKKEISKPGQEAVDNYKLWFDYKRKVLCFKQYNPLTVKDVYEVQPLAHKMVEGSRHHLVLVDLTEGPTNMVDKEARRAFRETANPKDYDKVAIFGASAATRMLAKVVLAITGVSKIAQFFKTEQEAIEWLKED